MSTHMKWYPPPPELEDDKYYISSLKFVLAEKLGDWGSSGSTCQNLGFVGPAIIPFLQGIIAGNGSGDMARDAEKLIEAIKQHGKVELKIEM